MNLVGFTVERDGVAWRSFSTGQRFYVPSPLGGLIGHHSTCLSVKETIFSIIASIQSFRADNQLPIRLLTGFVTGSKGCSGLTPRTMTPSSTHICPLVQMLSSSYSFIQFMGARAPPATT